MGNLLAPSHLILVVIVALLIFGPAKLPEIGKAFGRTLKEFKESIRDNDPEIPELPQGKPNRE